MITATPIAATAAKTTPTCRRETNVIADTAEVVASDSEKRFPTNIIGVSPIAMIPMTDAEMKIAVKIKGCQSSGRNAATMTTATTPARRKKTDVSAAGPSDAGRQTQRAHFRGCMEAALSPTFADRQGLFCCFSPVGRTRVVSCRRRSPSSSPRGLIETIWPFRRLTTRSAKSRDSSGSTMQQDGSAPLASIPDNPWMLAPPAYVNASRRPSRSKTRLGVRSRHRPIKIFCWSPPSGR